MNNNIKKDLIFTLTITLIVTGLLLTTIFIVRDIAIVTGQDWRSQETPREMIEAFEYYVENENMWGLRRIFSEDHYTDVFSEIFFGKDVDISYGYSDDNRLTSKKQLSSIDIPNIENYQTKNLTENTLMTYLIIEEANKEIDEMFFIPAAIVQEEENGWEISKLYDFIYTDSEIFEIDDFKINYMHNEFSISLKERKIDTDKMVQSTRLYNYALLIDNITVYHKDAILCVMTRENIRAEGKGDEFEIKSDILHNPKTINIRKDCELGDAVKGDRNTKSLLEIVLNSQDEKETMIYYGNMIE